MSAATSTQARRLALAAGDPNGIGPEIALKALAALPADARERITLFGPRNVLERTAVQLGLEAMLPALGLVDAGELPSHAAQPGRIEAAAGASAVASASAAIEACRRSEFDAVVACPHHETAIHQAGIAFSGYPSLVARVCGQAEDSVFLMLIGGGLRIVHATLHESVRQALGRLQPELIAAAVRAGVRACAAPAARRRPAGRRHEDPRRATRERPARQLPRPRARTARPRRHAD